MTGKPVCKSMKHRRSVTYVEYSRDGRFVATASRDNTARVWDARTGDAVTPPLQLNASVISARFSSDGRRLLTAVANPAENTWGSAGVGCSYRRTADTRMMPQRNCDKRLIQSRCSCCGHYQLRWKR